jgi:hypothetical protein
MLVTSFEMAQRLKETDTLHLARQVEPCSQLFTDQGIVAKPVGHGLAAVTLPEFGRKLNHIAGFEMAGQVSSEDLRLSRISIRKWDSIQRLNSAYMPIPLQFKF